MTNHRHFNWTVNHSNRIMRAKWIKYKSQYPNIKCMLAVQTGYFIVHTMKQLEETMWTLVEGNGM